MCDFYTIQLHYLIILLLQGKPYKKCEVFPPPAKNQLTRPKFPLDKELEVQVAKPGISQ